VYLAAYKEVINTKIIQASAKGRMEKSCVHAGLKNRSGSVSESSAGYISSRSVIASVPADYFSFQFSAADTSPPVNVSGDTIRYIRWINFSSVVKKSQGKYAGTGQRKGVVILSANRVTIPTFRDCFLRFLS
jgi:hypothetical protein